MTVLRRIPSSLPPTSSLHQLGTKLDMAKSAFHWKLQPARKLCGTNDSALNSPRAVNPAQTNHQKRAGTWKP